MITHYYFMMKQLPILSLAAIFLMSLTLVSCNDDPVGPDNGNGMNNGNGNGNGDTEQVIVEMQGMSFSPADIEVPVGTTVTWKNESNQSHTVTSGANREHDGIFDSGTVSPGNEFSWTFDETGTYDYYCIPHPGMEGTVTVVD